MCLSEAKRSWTSSACCTRSWQCSPSSCTPHSAVRCCAFECITPPFKVSFHNLWPPANLHLLGRCPHVLEYVARPTARENGGGGSPCLALFLFHSPHAAPWCAIIKQSQRSPGEREGPWERPACLRVTPRGVAVMAGCFWDLYRLILREWLCRDKSHKRTERSHQELCWWTSYIYMCNILNVHL